MNRRTALTMASTLLLSASALAQPAAPAGTPAPAPLGKPTGPAGASGFIERDAAGAVKRPDVSPGEAAVFKLDLTPEQRRQVEVILRERAKALDTFVREHIKDLVRLHTAVQNGLTGETRRLIQELQGKSDALRRLGRLPQEFAPALTAEQKRDLQRMVSHYWQERIREETIAAEARGEKLDLQQFMIDEQLYFVGLELKRSYERVFGQAAVDFDSLLRDLRATPEQAAKFREVAGPALDPESAARLSPSDRARLFFEVYARLTPDQRETVLARLKESPAVAAARAASNGVKPSTVAVPEEKK